MTDPLNLTRRSLMERMLLVVGAAAATGFSLPALAKSTAGKRYLDAPSFTLLSAIADTIVPKTDSVGALDADVPAKFDAMLKDWASGETRVQIATALRAIDTLALDAKGQPFARLDAQTRHDLLKPYDAKALKIVPKDTNGGVASLMGFPDYTDLGYGRIKELVVTLYYLSEPALTQELTYVHAPGDWKPSIPVTPDLRPAGGTLF